MESQSIFIIQRSRFNSVLYTFQTVPKPREPSPAKIMSSVGAARLPSTRTIKKVEKPRPLKNITRKSTCESYDDVMKLVDIVLDRMHNKEDNVRQDIGLMASHLKLNGQQLESIYGDQLDRSFFALRNFANNDQLDILTRLHLLELIELRAMHWSFADDTAEYYQVDTFFILIFSVFTASF
jgi:hypothetical protein